MAATVVIGRWGATHYGYLNDIPPMPYMLTCAAPRVHPCRAAGSAPRPRRHVIALVDFALRAAGSARHHLGRHTSVGVANEQPPSDGFSAKPLIKPRLMALVVTGRNLGRRSGGALRLWTRVDHRRARRDRRDGPRRASSQCGGTVRLSDPVRSRWELRCPIDRYPIDAQPNEGEKTSNVPSSSSSTQGPPDRVHHAAVNQPTGSVALVVASSAQERRSWSRRTPRSSPRSESPHRRVPPLTRPSTLRQVSRGPPRAPLARGREQWAG